MPKKLITVSVPVYNEQENIRASYERITAVMRGLEAYDYEIVYYDDGSTDGSRAEIEALCAGDERVKAVFYTRNFGYSKTVFYCMQQARGDAAVIIHCDLQNPPEMIPAFVEKWEQGADVVLGVKSRSRENKIVYFLRSLCYLIANLILGMKLTPHSTEFELFDRSFLNVLRRVKTSAPFLRGLVQEYAGHIEKVYYEQDKRARGKSHFTVSKYYTFAMEAMACTGRRLPRLMTLFSLFGALALALEFFIRFLPQTAAFGSEAFWTGLLLRFGVFLLLGLLQAAALLFEYLIFLSKNREEKPLILEEKRLNFETAADKTDLTAGTGE